MGGQRSLTLDDIGKGVGRISESFDDPLMGLAQGLLEAGQPSRTPQSVSSGLARGFGLASEMQRRRDEMDLKKQAFEENKRLHEAQLEKLRSGPQLHPSGDVANALYIEELREKYGEDSPVYLAAKRAHENILKGRESLIDYRGMLSQTAPFRATSALGKSIAEGRGEGALDIYRRAKSDESAGGIKPVDPQVAQAYERDIAKKTTDSDARKRYLFALNIDKTLSTINLDDLTAYSGIEGSGRYIRDQGLAASGKVPLQLKNHADAVESASFLADQMRQFYSDSIQPAAMERLRSLTNPSTWYKNPEIAKSQFLQLKKILEMETETYKKAGTSSIKLDRPLIDYKDGEFIALRPETNLKQANTKNSADDESIDWDLDAVSNELKNILPEATPENIRATQKQTGKSMQEIIEFLFQRRDEILGGDNG